MTTQIKSLDVSHNAVAIGNRLLAVILLIYFAPVMLAMAVLIKSCSQGPVFLRRSCRGVNGEIIALWEFRTTVDDGHDFDKSFGRQPSHTALDEFLRCSRFASMPRLINMLRGEVFVDALFQ